MNADNAVEAGISDRNAKAHEDWLKVVEEHKRFTATPAGAALQRFRYLLTAEVAYGENENFRHNKLQAMEDATRAQHEILVAEIKRLQAIEARMGSGS